MRPVAAVVEVPISPDRRPGTTTPGLVETSRFVGKVLGKDSVVRFHHLSAPSFAAVESRRYVPRTVTAKDLWRPPEDPAALAAEIAKRQAQADDQVATTSLLFQTLHDAYDAHLPVSLAPEVLWYAVCHEVAIAVKKDPDAYAHLYTTTPGEKQNITVSVDHYTYEGPNDWASGIQLFDGELRKRVPDGIMAHALPKFSTSTQESDVALLVAFMDAASPFYEYGMSTCCGIPKVRLEGTPEDWRTLVVEAQALSEVFRKDLGTYFDHLVPVLATLARAAKGEDVGTSFWQSMVKVDHGSGGPYVSGWVCAFWNYVCLKDGNHVAKDASLYDWTKGGHFHGMNPDDFTSHVSQVPFTWDYYGQQIPMALVSGVTGVELDGEFYCPRLGFAVVEKRS